MVATMVSVLGYPNIDTSNLMVCFTEQEALQLSPHQQPPELEANTGVSERQQLPASPDSSAVDLSVQQPQQQQTASGTDADMLGQLSIKDLAAPLSPKCVKAEFEVFEESAKPVQLKLVVSPQGSASPLPAGINVGIQSMIDEITAILNEINRSQAIDQTILNKIKQQRQEAEQLLTEIQQIAQLQEINETNREE